MIQRFCFVKLDPGAVEIRAQLADRLRADLAAAGANATIGLPADDSAARWDLSIVITCPTLADWQTLAATPAVTAIFDGLAARAEVVKAWTFSAVDL